MVESFIHLPTAEKLLDQHRRGAARNGQILWSLLVLASWAERYLRPDVTAVNLA
jgi:hypothetical protein